MHDATTLAAQIYADTGYAVQVALAATDIHTELVRGIIHVGMSATASTIIDVATASTDVYAGFTSDNVRCRQVQIICTSCCRNLE